MSNITCLISSSLFSSSIVFLKLWRNFVENPCHLYTTERKSVMEKKGYTTIWCYSQIVVPRGIPSIHVTLSVLVTPGNLQKVGVDMDVIPTDVT